MFDVEVKVSSAKDLVDRMSALPDKLQKKGAVAAARKAMKLVVNSARAEARQLDSPESPNRIWKNIVSQNSPRGGKRIGGVVMRVGVRGGAQFSEEQAAKAKDNPGGYTWYWRYLEHGTRYIVKDAFLLPALERNAQAVTDKLGDELEAEIAKLTPKASSAPAAL